MLILMQGASGSGKSTIANFIKHGIGKHRNIPCYIFSADDYFMTSDGTYHFDQSKLSNAHQNCYDLVMHVIQWNWNDDVCVIVDNTNTRKWEAQKYIDLAMEFGHTVQVVRVDSYCFQSTHDVPAEVVKQQRKRMEDLLS